MTNTELKNNIDAAITNKTSVSSITPVNVGNQMKSTVDYIDQEIASIPTSTSGAQILKSVKRTISHAEILTMVASPILLIQQETGKVKLPLSMLLRKNSGGKYSGGAGFKLVNQLNQNLGISISGSSFFLENVGETQMSILFDSFSDVGNVFGVTRTEDTGLLFNEVDYYFTYNGTPFEIDPSTGSTTIDIYITYLEINL
jgi:hypothetical protein